MLIAAFYSCQAQRNDAGLGKSNWDTHSHSERWITDLESGIETAKKQERPILLYFNGYACINSRKMEENVFVGNEVSRLLDRFVWISPYVDERGKLPEDKLQDSLYQAAGIETVGQENSLLQTCWFYNNSQPYFVVVDVDGNVYGERGYTPGAQEFGDFLSNSLELYEAHRPLKTVDLDVRACLIVRAKSRTSFNESSTDKPDLIASPTYKREHATIQFEVKKVADSQYEVVCALDLDPGFRIWSAFVNEDGPIGVGLQSNNASCTQLGDYAEFGTAKAIDSNFEMELEFFNNGGGFRQQVYVDATTCTTIDFELAYMIGSDQFVLPPEYLDVRLDLPAE